MKIEIPDELVNRVLLASWPEDLGTGLEEDAAGFRERVVPVLITGLLEQVVLTRTRRESWEADAMRRLLAGIGWSTT